MTTDRTIEYVRSVNPVALEAPAPPVGPLLERLDSSIRGLDDPFRAKPRRTAGAPLGRLAAGTAVATGITVAAITLTGGAGPGAVSVAAAVDRAITPGPGVLHIVMSTENTVDGHLTTSTQQQIWSVQNPRRQRVVTTLRTGGETVEDEGALLSTNPPQALSWSAAEPGTIHEDNSPFDRTVQSPVAWLHSAYAAGRLKVIGKSELNGRPVWRLEVLTDPAQAPQTINGQPVPAPTVLVDANTFTPLENVIYSVSGQKGSQALDTTTVHYTTYEELPASPSNESLLNLADHPGAKIVKNGTPG